MTTRRRYPFPATGAICFAVLVALAGAPSAAAAPGVPPGAAFSITPNPAQEQQLVTFDASASTGDGQGSSIAAYEWDLDGDGVFEVNTGVNPTTARSYTDPVTITVRLRVTDNEGDVDGESTVFRVNAPPTAGFIHEPSKPRVKRPVTLSSTSSDPDGLIYPSAHAWDTDGDGEFDDLIGETVTISFTSAGKKTVGLRVTDADGAIATSTRIIRVESKRSAQRLISPFPVVRLVGELRGDGSTEIDRLSIRAPRGSRVTVRCRGESCPFDVRKQRVERRTVAIRAIERRLRPGVVIEVYVTQPGRIGKFTRFRLRDGDAPKRRDRCLTAGSRRVIKCPRS